MIMMMKMHFISSMIGVYRRHIGSGTVLVQYCAIPYSPVSWSVFALHPSSSNKTAPDEQRLYDWKPAEVGDYYVVVGPYTLNPGEYRFEAQVGIQRTVN